MLSSINLSVWGASSTQDSDASFTDDDDDDDKTSSDSVSELTNEVSRFFDGGLVACFNGYSLNIEGTLPALTFFFPLPKVVVRSSFLKWNLHTYIFLFGFFTSKGYAPLFLQTCFSTLSYFFLRSSLNPKTAGGEGEGANKTHISWKFHWISSSCSEDMKRFSVNIS